MAPFYNPSVSFADTSLCDSPSAAAKRRLLACTRLRAQYTREALSSVHLSKLHSKSYPCALPLAAKAALYRESTKRKRAFKAHTCKGLAREAATAFRGKGGRLPQQVCKMQPTRSGGSWHFAARERQ